MGFFDFMTEDIAIDLGTANTLIIHNDKVVIGLDLKPGLKEVSVQGIFENGMELRDGYSGKKVTVENEKVSIDSGLSIVLLEQI